MPPQIPIPLAARLSLFHRSVGHQAVRHNAFPKTALQLPSSPSFAPSPCLCSFGSIRENPIHDLAPARSTRQSFWLLAGQRSCNHIFMPALEIEYPVIASAFFVGLVS